MQEGDIIKALAIFGTLVSGLAGLLVFPLKDRYAKAQNQERFNVLMSYNNSFGGGVILGVGLLHMLADATEKLSDYYHYPWAFFMAAVGYAIIYLIEEVLVNQFMLRFKSIIEKNGMADIAHTHDANPCCSSRNHINEQQHLLSKDNATEEHTIIDINTGKKGYKSINPKLSLNNTTTIVNVETVDDLEQSKKYDSMHASLVALAFLAALSFHAFFEGLSMGVTTNFANVFAILFATTSHKAIAAFVLGQSFLKSKLPKISIVLFLVLFAVMTPAGVAVGWMLTDIYSGNEDSKATLDILSGFINAISAGTFIYIGSLIRKDAPDVEHNISNLRANIAYKYVFFWIGMGAMAIAAIYA